ncbi:MAG: acylphosphatase [Lachnospiraceae bacterium]|nr:acylphosphatase [Lachnospiraceae bacterium]
MKRMHIIISGRVQGVGFRYFAVSLASRYHITGWVRNLYNGDVEMEAEGNSTRLTLFLQEIQEGNRFVRVRNMEISEIPLAHDKDFKVVY